MGKLWLNFYKPIKQGMPLLLTAVFIELVLVNSIAYAERKYKVNKLQKWAKGEMTMKELLWLKKQPWFQRAFKLVEVEKSKKND